MERGVSAQGPGRRPMVDGAPTTSSDSELEWREEAIKRRAAKQQFQSQGTNGTIKASPARATPGNATGAGAGATAGSSAGSDSDSEPFDMVAAAKRSSASKAARASRMPGRPASPAVSAPGQAPCAAAPSTSNPTAAHPGHSTDSDSDGGLDIMALAKQRTRAAAVVSSAQRPAAAAAVRPEPAQLLQQPPTAARTPATELPARPQATAGPGMTCASTLPGPPASTVQPAPTLLDLASTQLPPLLHDVEQHLEPAAAHNHHHTAGTQVAPTPARAALPAVPTPVAVPLASLTDLGGMVQSAVSGAVGELRSDLGRLEAGWQAQWQEQATATADLRVRLGSLQTSSTSQAQEVQGRLQGLQAELALQRSRLDVVERLQQAHQVPLAASNSPSKLEDRLAAAADGNPGAAIPPSSITTNPVWEPANSAPSSAPLAEQGSGMPTVDAILKRLSLLEDRVGAQLQDIQAACTPSSPRSEPVSPLKSGSWDNHSFSPCSGSCGRGSSIGRNSPGAAHRSQAQAAQAGAFAAAAVYGHGGPSQTYKFTGSLEVAPASAATLLPQALPLPTSPHILAVGGLPRPTSAAGTIPSRRSKYSVDQQVCETHAIIANIQSQIAAIKHSLAATTGELDARHLEAGSTAQRISQLEMTDRYMTKMEAANVAGVTALERRVRSLEDQVAGVRTQATASGLVARNAQAAVSALQWRVDKSSDATLDTIKALECRQGKLRSVAATATLADAKVATLASEVARLQRRVQSGCSPPLSPCSKPVFRLF